MLDIMVPIGIALGAAGALGYMVGRWSGYKDGLPKRDKHGRFLKD